MGEGREEFVRGTCAVVHPTLGPCSLDETHRGAHMTKRKVWSYRHEFFGTNEPSARPSSPLEDR